MTDANERWADSREKSTERYSHIKDDSTALDRGPPIFRYRRSYSTHTGSRTHGLAGVSRSLYVAMWNIT